MTGAELTEARIVANLSQRELAERLGVSLRSIQHWESGTTPQPRHRRLIAEFFDSVRKDAAA